MRSRFILAAAVLLILSNFVANEAVLGAEVMVDGAQRYQTIEGFGTCLIAWVSRFRELYRTEEFQRIYVEGVGCNMLRVNMWGPTFEKQTEDWKQISCEDFDIDHIVPFCVLDRVADQIVDHTIDEDGNGPREAVIGQRRVDRDLFGLRGCLQHLDPGGHPPPEAYGFGRTLPVAAAEPL